MSLVLQFDRNGYGFAPPAGRLIVADGLRGGVEPFDVRRSLQASIIRDTQPDSPETQSTVAHSAWQAGTVILAVERFFGASVARPRSVAAIAY